MYVYYAIRISGSQQCLPFIHILFLSLGTVLSLHHLDFFLVFSSESFWSPTAPSITANCSDTIFAQIHSSATRCFKYGCIYACMHVCKPLTLLILLILCRLTIFHPPIPNLVQFRILVSNNPTQRSLQTGIALSVVFLFMQVQLWKWECYVLTERQTQTDTKKDRHQETITLTQKNRQTDRQTITVEIRRHGN
jgi:hypothetical protein